MTRRSSRPDGTPGAGIDTRRRGVRQPSVPPPYARQNTRAAETASDPCASVDLMTAPAPRGYTAHVCSVPGVRVRIEIVESLVTDARDIAPGVNLAEDLAERLRDAVTAR